VLLRLEEAGGRGRADQFVPRVREVVVDAGGDDLRAAHDAQRLRDVVREGVESRPLSSSSAGQSQEANRLPSRRVNRTW
jgi:hypothetical protein